MIISVGTIFTQFFFSPEDGDIDSNTGRVMILYPGAQVEEAGEQQVNARHHCRHDQQLGFSDKTPLNDAL